MWPLWFVLGMVVFYALFILSMAWMRANALLRQVVQFHTRAKYGLPETLIHDIKHFLGDDTGDDNA